MPTTKATFPGAQGQILAGRLDLPEGPPKAYALFAHCFTCSKDIFAASRVSTALTEQGIAVLRFDFTGLGSSEGEFANSNFSSNVGDLAAAADYLRAEHEAPRILIGHSLGGTAVLVAAARIPEAVAVSTINAPCDPAHMQHLIAAEIDTIWETGEAEVSIGGRKFRIQRQFLEDISSQNLKQAIGSLRRALLVFHSPTDATVDVENARRIFELAKHPKSFVALDGADHLLSRREDAEFVARVLAAWASRYLPDGDAAEAEAPSPPAPATAVAPGEAGEPGEPGTVTVTESGLSRLSQTIHDGRHTLAADEPERLGGADSGPSPYELLLASLGACTSITVRMYADRKQWPLERISVRLKHEKIHARDCAECETREGRLDRIEREISLDGPLDAEQRGRLMEIADKCPVHRTLHSEVVVETRLAEG